MKKILLIIIALFLASCNSLGTPIVTKMKLTVAAPDESMYACPVVKKFPEYRTLTEAQVAKLLVELHKNNLTCKSSMDALRKFIQEYKRIVEKQGA